MVAVPPLTLLLATVASSAGHGGRPSPHCYWPQWLVVLVMVVVPLLTLLLAGYHRG